MIFVTIGTQEPFDRLIQAVDQIASKVKHEKFVAQLSKTNYRPRHMKHVEFITPKEFDSYVAEARLIISHAGMGTIISALVAQKPIIVVPRLTKYKEHRNEHQLATAKSFSTMDFVKVAYDTSELKNMVFDFLSTEFMPQNKIGQYASPKLIESIKEYIS